MPAESAVLAAERAHLAESRAALRRMREHAESLSADVAGDWVSAQFLESLLEQRVAALADHPGAPLFFGRMDRDDAVGGGDSGAGDLPAVMYVGRRHVHDGDEGRPLVLDWRAPVSRAFYQAGPADPMGWRLRRRFGFSGGELTAFEDEPLRGGAAGPSRILTEEIERPRTGPMRDIVATIQPDQDEIVRADLPRTVCVQGAPGTGKTAVGLHRAAYLLFTHRERLARSGVLIVGPNRAFLGYISAVLPALGEVGVEQATIDDLLGAPTAEEPAEASAVKGEARMADVLRKALWLHVTKPAEGLVVTRGSARYRLADHEVREIAAALRGTTRYGSGRAAFAQRLAHRILVQMEKRGEAPDDRVQEQVARSKPVKHVLDTVWPKVTPEQVLYRLLADPAFLGRAAKGLLDEAEQAAILWPKPARSHRSARWTAADRALLDELRDLVERTASLGHLVVDEAQDLSAMQLRALGRRCGTGSATVLGDLAQGTTAWSARSWREVLAHLGQDGDVTELTLGFRVPGTVLDFAARLLPHIAPALERPRSLRPGAGALEVRRVPDLGAAVVAAAREALARPGSVGLIVPDAAVAAHAAALEAAGLEHAVLGPGPGGGTRLLVVPATLAKGLEYDQVVVAEPAAIAAAEARGLARLYVVLTRAVTSLTVLHRDELPAELNG
ncbi:HelD family protein [Actinomadura livida]|uniref:AAA family ATPase n=1 Tax=Actinomadura livida TaxID=79909 RepID=A0A7W7IDX4_9ACTN|nr:MULTISPECIES: AAA family ATPase [Actinomadura]MBB4775124.1 DNA helicase IV [Actinomadura catellatispora]GGT87998.1 DNA helicase [Actinomadura livida]